MNLKNIGLSTSAFGYAMGNTGKNTERRNPDPWTLEQFIEFAAERGFGGIEAPLLRFVPDLDQARLKKIKSMLLERGMFFVIDAEKPLNIDEIENLIPYAKEFNSPVIRIKSSSVLECAREKLGKPWREHVENCVSVLTNLAPDLRKFGIKIAIENHQDLDSNDLLEIVERVGSDIVGVNFDIGNAFSTCEDPRVFTEKLGSSILNVHLKDYKIYKSEDGFRLVRCPLGEGAVDFKTVLPIIEKNSPRANMVVELGALESRSIGFLKPGFWDHIAPRQAEEKKAFEKILEAKALNGDAWQTPWESGAAAPDIISYEIRQAEESIPYIKQL